MQTGLIDAHSEPVQQILKAAETTFASAGYAAASMREIARLADVSKSLLHYHFQSKEHLFLEVLARIYERLAERLTAAAAAPGATSTDRALAALDALFVALRRSPDFQAQARIWARSLSNAALEAHAERMREQLRTTLVRAIERILGEARARLPLDAEVAADLLWAIVTGLGLSGGGDDAEIRAAQAHDGLKRMVALALVTLAAAPDEPEPTDSR